MSDEKQMLRDSAERFLRDNYDFADRQASVNAGEGMDANHWRAFSEMGWTAMAIPENAEALALDSPTLPHSLNYLANIWFESLFSNPLYLQEAS